MRNGMKYLEKIEKGNYNVYAIYTNNVMNIATIIYIIM